MLRHNLRSAWRTIRRNPFYSLINIGCLSIGIAVCMMILIYILHERSFDSWHRNSQRIFTVYTSETFGAMTFRNSQLSGITGPAAKQADPSVDAFMRLFRLPEGAGIEMRNEGEPTVRFWEDHQVVFADTNFFSFFSFRLVRGQREAVLARPSTVVLTETEARKYFGKADPVGKLLVLQGKYRLEVTGIAADVPSNSSINFGFVISMGTLGRMKEYSDQLNEQRLQMGNFDTWLLLKNRSDTAMVERNLKRIAVAAIARAPKDAPAGAFTETHEFYLRPVTDTHLGGPYGASNRKYLGPLVCVALVILLLAMVNYMSLATARAAARAREVGVRKVIGAGRWRVAGQFYTESSVFALFSFFSGILVFILGRHLFFDLLGLSIDSRFLYSPPVIGFFVTLLGVLVLFAGSYPSLVLSAFRPVTALYGKFGRQRSGERVRKGFIVLQFTTSMALIICSAIISKELYFIRHMETGIDRENVVMLPFGETMEHYSAYKQEIAALPFVQRVATTHYELYSGGLIIHLVQLPDKPTPVEMIGLTADTNLIPLLGLKWKEAPAAGTSWYGKKHVLLNEAAAETFDLGNVGSARSLRIDDSVVTVAGILKNFNYLSLHTPIKPFGITVVRDADKEWQAGFNGCLYVKIVAHTNLAIAMEALRNLYSKYDSRSPFQFQFLDEAFDSNYKQEDRLGGLFRFFALVTIVIACLGLFALATFAAQQRIKEIGIRKVLGASVTSIGLLLSRDFLRPVLLAVLIACPISWWLMNRWLQDYAYRTPMSWWIFVAAGLGLLGIALVTVLMRSLRAGRANPIDNLRTE